MGVVQTVEVGKRRFRRGDVVQTTPNEVYVVEEDGDGHVNSVAALLAVVRIVDDKIQAITTIYEHSGTRLQPGTKVTFHGNLDSISPHTAAAFRRVE